MRKAILLTILFAAAPAYAQSHLQSFSSSVTPTVSTSPAYTAGDAIGGEMAFSNVCSHTSRTVEIRQVVVTDLNPEGLDLGLVLFSSDPATSTADNAALDIDDADLALDIVEIPITSHKSYNDNGISYASNVSYTVKCNSDGKVYGRLVARHASGTLQYAGTSDVTVVLSGYRN